MKTSEYLAVDLGATSGRTILASYDGEKVTLREFTRFKNPIIHMGGHLFWDIAGLYNEIITALKKVAEEKIELTSIGIDTWGVDFAFFGEDKQLLSLPYCYRDAHTEGAQDRYFRKHDKRELYMHTGIQFMDFNSIFQLDTLRRNGCTALENAEKILFMPDALTYLLTGKAVCEYTIASTSQLINPVTKDFDKSVLKSIKIKKKRFGKLVQPGTVVGTLSEEVRTITGLGKIKVVAVAGHDTASAVAAVPATDKHYAYLSCGTWSLLGVESETPIISEESFSENFTNEGGLDGSTRFLKNICGLWLFEQSRICPEFKDAPQDIASLSALCMKSEFDSIIAPDDPSFAHPESMTAAIREYCRKTGQAEPQEAADYVRCVYRSLARRYREVVDKLGKLAGFEITSLNVIGGGSKNPYLMQFTADELGIPVISGPSEATALGNALVQVRAAGLIKTREQMHEISARSVETVKYTPKN